METIRILVYADTPDFSDKPGSLKGGLADLKRFAIEKAKDIADVTFTFLQRHGRDENGKEINAENKLTDELLREFEEVWFFGVRQIDTSAQPNNELTPEEVDVLHEWMRTGGVFLTGDHSSPDPTTAGSHCSEKGHGSFLGVGRALGHKIPRAGQLRIWKGPPTACLEGELNELDNFNTQDGFDPCDLDNPLLQYDHIPQTLHLTRTLCFPHRLFWFEDENSDVTEIERLPDHWHEGEVVVPDQLDSEWNVHSRPPVIVARGRDKRFPDQHPLRGLIAAYDGYEDKEHPERSAGRIVADSSFHHYLDINLKNLRSRDASGLPIVGSDLDQIANFYGNLAWWLAPKAVRKNMKLDLLFRLSKHPDVIEVIGNSTEVIGRTANAVLNATIGPAKLKRFLASSGFESSHFADDLFSLVFLGMSSRLPAFFIKPDLFLGASIEVCHEYFSAYGDVVPILLKDRELLRTIEGSIATTMTKLLRAFGDAFVG
jgi:hypothetical protein